MKLKQIALPEINHGYIKTHKKPRRHFFSSKTFAESVQQWPERKTVKRLYTNELGTELASYTTEKIACANNATSANETIQLQ